MSCVANHTKLLEGVTRELRLELAAYHQQLISRKNTSRRHVNILYSIYKNSMSLYNYSLLIISLIRYYDIRFRIELFAKMQLSLKMSEVVAPIL